MKVLMIDRGNYFAGGDMTGFVNSSFEAMPCSTYSDALELAHSDSGISACLFFVGTIDEPLSQFLRQMRTAAHRCRTIAVMLSPNADDYIALTLNGVDECFTVPVDMALFPLALGELNRQRALEGIAQ